MALPIRASLEALLPERWRKRRPRVALVRLVGTIGAGSPFRPGPSLVSLAGPLEQAFATPHIAAVALVINSPGGSPAQSHLIHQRIRALATETSVPVYAFVEDVAAAGGYLIACAADEIVADPTSLVGSIGVLPAGTEFDGLILRLGVDRRVHSSGETKFRPDPFRTDNPFDLARSKRIHADVQDLFTTLVRDRRPRLDAAGENLFTGAVWTGRQALHLGLVDGLGDVRSTLRARFGADVRVVTMAETRTSFTTHLRRQSGFVNEAGFGGDEPGIDEDRATSPRSGR